MPRRRTDEQPKLPTMNVDWYAGKVPCPDCGLPRDLEYAKRAPCTCCGHWGLEPIERWHDDDEFEVNEDGGLVLKDKSAKRQKPVKAERPVEVEQPRAEPRPKADKAAATTADLFLAALF